MAYSSVLILSEDLRTDMKNNSEYGTRYKIACNKTLWAVVSEITASTIPEMREVVREWSETRCCSWSFCFRLPAIYARELIAAITCKTSSVVKSISAIIHEIVLCHRWIFVSVTGIISTHVVPSSSGLGHLPSLFATKSRKDIQNLDENPMYEGSWIIYRMWSRRLVV